LSGCMKEEKVVFGWLRVEEIEAVDIAVGGYN
jgi:hypothetical protein